MSALWIGLIGAITGLLVGEFVTASRQWVVIDVTAGAIGAWLTVLMSRIALPFMGDGIVMSSVMAVVGALITLILMNRFLRGTLLATPGSRRRM